MDNPEPQKLKKNQKKAGRRTKPTRQADEPEKSFDFGGLPQRDLKKNLGCG